MKFVELDARDFIPSGGQGALAIETLANVPNELDRALAAINDARAFYETAAERTFLATIGASCTTPVGVRAKIDAGKFAITAMLFSADGEKELLDMLDEPVGPALEPSAAENSGKRLAEKVLARGAGALLGK